MSELKACRPSGNVSSFLCDLVKQARVWSQWCWGRGFSSFIIKAILIINIILPHSPTNNSHGLSLSQFCFSYSSLHQHINIMAIRSNLRVFAQALISSEPIVDNKHLIVVEPLYGWLHSTMRMVRRDHPMMLGWKQVLFSTESCCKGKEKERRRIHDSVSKYP